MSAVIAPTLSDRVDELARQVQELRDTPQDTIATTNTFVIGGKEKTEVLHKDMFWEGGWDREAAYEVGAVVRYKKKSYVNVFDIAAKPAKLGPLPPESETLRVALATVTQFIDSGEEIEAEILPTDPHLSTRYEGALSSRLYQFRTPSGSKISLPKSVTPANTEAHYSIFDSDGHERAGNQHEIVEGTLEGGVRDKNLFFLLVYAGEIGGIGLLHAPYPIPFQIALMSSGGLTNEPGNTPPSEDTSHWALLAGA